MRCGRGGCDRRIRRQSVHQLDGDGAVTGYEVYRAGADGKWQQVTRTRDAFYTDKKLAAETTYSYKVRSYLVADGETYYGEFTGAVTGTTTK